MSAPSSGNIASAASTSTAFGPLPEAICRSLVAFARTAKGERPGSTSRNSPGPMRPRKS